MAPSIAAPNALRVPAGSLADAIVTLARQTGASIGFPDSTVGGVRVRGVTGRLTTAQALGRLLAGSGLRAERIDAVTWRIERTPVRPPLAVLRRRLSTPSPVPAGSSEIVVTASKRDVPREDYAGGIDIVSAAGLDPEAAARGSEALVARLPTLGSTELGPGRNKLFIRGIADSSFNGPTQATTGQYLGDVRLTYDAPDPDLWLVDIASVEVLEGPQGTLYGAGTLGGIVRIVPNGPVLDDVSLALSLGGTITPGHAGGGDAAAVANLPLVRGRLGLRLTFYGGQDGGYIDDASRNLHDVNRTRTIGGRGSLRFEPGDGWAIELGGLVQNINTRDGQYADRSLPPLTRASTIAQPFDNDYGLGSLVISRDWGALKLVSTSAIVAQDANSRYDFTSIGTPTAFDQTNRIRLVSLENRLSRRGVDGRGWVIGVSVLADSEQLYRYLGPVAAPARLLSVSNRVTSVAGFADYGLGLAPGLLASIGGRLEFERQVGEPLDPTGDELFEAARSNLVALPSVGLNWRPGRRWRLYARYASGFRPGGISVDQALNVQRFKDDGVGTAELGIGFGGTGDPLSLSLTGSHVRWRDIQADLVTTAGLPYTTTIGTGRIWSVEANGQWHPVQPLRFAASLLFNDGKLVAAVDPADAGERLPNVPRLGASLSASIRSPIGGGRAIEGRLAMRYTGHSQLAVASGFELQQGGYVDLGGRLALDLGRVTLSLDASNLLDTVGNRFALGNPFDVADGRQYVPLRPRTLRLGLDTRF